MVSQFGSLGYTIMGKTADLTVVQKTIIDTLHKEGKPQTFIAKEAGCSQSAVSKHVNRELSGRKKVWKKKMHNQPREPQPYEDCQAKSIQEFGWTSQGMDWGWGQGIKSHPHIDVSRNLATVVVRGVLPGLRRRRTGLLPSGPKCSFQMRANFVFHFETKVKLESGEAHSPSCLKFSVKFTQSVIIWGAMSSAGVGPLCFLKTKVTAPFTKKSWSTSCFLLLTSFLKMLISFSSRIWHLPTLPKVPKVG